MLAQTVQTKQPATVATSAPLRDLPRFVTLAYAWGFEDGATGEQRRGWHYWTLDDPRYAEYSEGHDAGLVAAQLKGR